MVTIINRSYKKKIQKDYTISFKLQVVKELGTGELTKVQSSNKYGIQSGSTLHSWLKKYGTFDLDYGQTQPMMKSKTPEKRILR